MTYENRAPWSASPRQRFRTAAFFFALAGMVMVTACRPAQRAPLPEAAELAGMGLSAADYVSSIDAVCPVPLDWSAEPLKKSHNHRHQVWLSPSGSTAYGVIRFSMPLPLGHDFVLRHFLRQMRESEGEAKLLSEQWDANLHGIRFVAEGGLYKIRTNLMVRGFRGWAVYAGTLRDQPVQPQELELAERARELTVIGRPPVN